MPVPVKIPIPIEVYEYHYIIDKSFFQNAQLHALNCEPGMYKENPNFLFLF